MSLVRIAGNLGLSVTTVSRALTGYGDVAPATRARVQAEAERIAYRPNAAARRLRSGRSDAIGLVLPAAPGQFDDPFFLRLLAAIGPRLAGHGLDLLVTAAPPGAGEMRAYRHLVEGRRVDGMLVARTRIRDARIEYLLGRGLPFVAHGRTDAARAYAHLDADGESAFGEATRRLIGFGHRRIALLNAPGTYTYARHREAGWRTALREAGLAEDTPRRAEPTEENGYHLAAAVLRQERPPTALLCATDRLAIGALHAIAEAGLQAGRDVSVIGHDDLPAATHTSPPLTTFEQPIERMAARLTEMLVARLGGADPAGFAETWPVRLVPRASDGPIRAETAASDGGNTSTGRDRHATPLHPGA